MSPRTGRPKSDKPKNYTLKVRFDKESYDELEEFCEEKNLTKAEVIREGIKLRIGKEE